MPDRVPEMIKTASSHDGPPSSRRVGVRGREGACLIIAALGTLSAAHIACADVLFSDSFRYPLGPLAGNGGGIGAIAPWTGGSGPSGNIVSEPLTTSASDPTAQSVRIARNAGETTRSLSAAYESGGSASYYVSFLFNATSFSLDGQYAGVAFYRASDRSQSLLLGMPGDTGGLGFDWTNRGQEFSIVSAGTTYLVLCAVVPGNSGTTSVVMYGTSDLSMSAEVLMATTPIAQLSNEPNFGFDSVSVAGAYDGDSIRIAGLALADSAVDAIRFTQTGQTGTIPGIDDDGDGSANADDCAPLDATRYPGAPELCVTEGTDNDCDGDAYDADDAQTFYLDADGDGAGASDATIVGCSAPPGYVAVAGDSCPLNPFALAPIRWYRDADGDAFGDPDVSVLACSQPAGYIPESTDCDDTRAHANPAGHEVCDPSDADEDCDGLADDDDPSATGQYPWFVDGDSDGFGSGASTLACDAPTASHVDNDDDCSDSDPARYPGAIELCGTVGTDNDCDNDATDTDDNTPDGTTFWGDADGDGFGDPAVTRVTCSQPAGYAANALDRCPESVALRDPVAYFIDDDGDGFGGPTTADFCATIAPPGHTAASTDCDDANPLISPAAQEICDAGDTDEDCDHLADDADPSATGQSAWHLDQDGDGFGDPDNQVPACDQPVGRVANGDDECPAVGALHQPLNYHVDGDGDGYGGSATAALCATSAPPGYTGGDDDCDDANALIHAPVRYYADVDGDGAGDAESFIDVCSLDEPEGYVSATGDSCPNDPAKTSPSDCGCGAVETDDDGDGVSDCIDPTPALRMIAAGDGTFLDGDPIIVHIDVSARTPSQPTVGAQVVVRYDRTRIAFVGAAPGSGAGGVFNEQISLSHDSASGIVRYAVGVSDAEPGSTEAGRVCTLTFGLADGVSALCDESGLLEFWDEGEVETRLTTAQGDPIYGTEFDLGAIRAFDAPLSLAGVPESWERPADAGIAGSVFVQPDVSVTTGCGSVEAGLSIELPDGSSSDEWPSGGIFPIGTTTVTWSASALPGMDPLTATRSFTVLDAQLLQLTLSLQGAIAAPSEREVRVAVGSDIRTVTVELGSSVSAATVDLLIPVTLSAPCVSAKDPVHSLTASAASVASGTAYAATLSLRQGDSNNDDAIDILDFGVLVADYGPALPSGRSNFNGDAVVNNIDFSFISFSFFQTGVLCDGGLAGGAPADRVSVGRLRKMGYGDLVAADINGDGWVDTSDIALWMQGVRPDTDAGDASSGGSAAE